MTTPTAVEPQVLYWHRELPPLTAEAIGEHILEATSRRVPGRFPATTRSGAGVMETS